MMTVEEFAKHFDLAYLSPNLEKKDIIEACQIAKKYGLNAVNVNSCWGKLIVEELAGSKVGPSAVIGFPYGAMSLNAKIAELKEMIDVGCTANDWVINYGALNSGDWDLIEEEVKAFSSISKGKAKTKLIFEVAFLSDEAIAKLAKLASKYEIDYVKTATGTQGFPDMKHVEIMKDNIFGNTKIKVSGVPRTFTMAAAKFLFEEMGVSLVGTRSAGRLVEEYKNHYFKEESN